MNDAEGDPLASRDPHWQVQPAWVKAVTLLIGLPAWLVLGTSAFTGNIAGTLQMVAFGVFGAVALLQLVFIFRAYWRMDL